jgi:DNA-binding NarL/FixJ family response regulator
MTPQINVGILEDHHSIIDGYNFRLSKYPNIEVVATASYGDALDGLLAEYEIDVLILDIRVPTSPDNPNPYPILNTIPKLLDKYPNLSILVISMHLQPGLIQAVMDAGARGYIVKDDQATIIKLGEVIETVASGGIHLSDNAYQVLRNKGPADKKLTPRQLEAISLCASLPGATTAQLADQLEVAHSTFRNLLSNAYLRLDVPNRTAAIEKARQLGLITPLQAGIEF